MNLSLFKPSSDARVLAVLVLAFVTMLVGTEVMAQTTPAGGGFTVACTNVQLFFRRFETILKVVSVSIVTIAIVFAGYQIAFAHKRLSDVAPILIGGLLIGGAAAIAGWFTTDFLAAGGAAATC